MKPVVNRWIVAAAPILAVLTAAWPVVAQVRGPSEMIFDGQSLKGWVNAAGQPVTQGWTTGDGVLYRQSPGGDLFFHREVGDFELTFRWKTTVKGNSGVKYRVKRFGNQWLGCEYQIQDDAPGQLNRHASGSLYDVHEPIFGALRPVGQWNDARIVVFDDQIQHYLNGRKTVDIQVGSADWNQRIAQSKFRDQAGFGENQTGRIFLQDHGTEVWFRDIVLTPLYSASSVAAVAPSSNICCCQPTRLSHRFRFRSAMPRGLARR